MPTLRPSPLVLFEDAKKQARELDEEFSRTGKLRGPLHGVPMSFKDQCTHLHGVQYIHILNVCADEIVGYDATIGFTHWANKPSTKDAFVSQILVLMPFCCTHPSISLSLNAEKREPSSLSRPMCLKQCSRSNAPMHSGAEPPTRGVTNILVEVVLAEVRFLYSRYSVVMQLIGVHICRSCPVSNGWVRTRRWLGHRR